MTKREMTLAYVLVGAVLVVGLGFLYLVILRPGYDQVVAEGKLLADANAAKEKQIDEVEKRKADLERWRKESLPPNSANPKWTSGEYVSYLSETLSKCDFTQNKHIAVNMEADNPNAPAIMRNKKLGYTRYTFKVEGHATLGNMVKFLERFYHMPLLHQIKILKMHRPATDRQTATDRQNQQARDELDVEITIEALALDSGDKRTTLMAKNSEDPKLLAETPRAYSDIANKNIFFGLTPLGSTSARDNKPKPWWADSAKFTHLTSISKTSEGPPEAFIYDISGPHNKRLRCERGFDSFSVENDKGESVRCIVDRIELENHRIVFHTESNKKYYALRFGEALSEALRKPLKDEQMKELGLVSTESK